MSDQTHYHTLFAYHFQATRQLMDKAAELDEAGRKQSPGYGHGSIHDLLLHLLTTDHGWREGLETGQQPPPLRREDYPDLPSLRAGFESEQAAWQALLDKLGEAAIEGDVNLTSLGGQTYPIPRWRILQHLVLHGMQHHAEVAQLLTERGRSPGNLDFIFYD